MSDDEERKCFLCSSSTDFLAHAPDVCLSCGDNAQDPKWSLEVMRRYHKACSANSVSKAKIDLIKRIYEIWKENPDRSQGQHSEPCMYDIGKILAS